MNRPCHPRYALFDLLDRRLRLFAVATLVRRSGTKWGVYILFDKRLAGRDPVRQLIEGRMPSLCIGRSIELRNRLSQLVCGIESGTARHGFTTRLLSGQIPDFLPDDVGVILISTNHPASLEKFLFWEHVARHGAFPIGNRKAPDRQAGNSGEVRIDITWATIFSRHNGRGDV
tara:strand:+ start:4282 stop:4800 length:519 start_codon:yes stop_codon:yes gene_type:complete